MERRRIVSISELRGGMPSRMVKRGIWALGVAVVVMALLVAFFPLIASTQIVRDRIVLEMSAWSGYRVALGSSPEINVFPTFRATLNNVTLSDWRETQRLPVIEAERVEIDLSTLAALAGNIVFSDVRLVRPTFRVVPYGPIYATALPGGGRMVRKLVDARTIVAANPVRTDLYRLS